MKPSHTDTLKVPGATIHYEVCGFRPVLLCIPGGPADGGAFAPLRDVLADRYKVVTYDPRGLSRSPFDGEPQDTTVQTFATTRTACSKRSEASRRTSSAAAAAAWSDSNW